MHGLILGIGVGALIVRPDYRKKVEKFASDVFTKQIKPFGQGVVDNLNKESGADAKDIINESSNEEPAQHS